MNVPNQLTIARICSIPIFVFFMLTDYVSYSKYIAVIIFILASLTDLLDGKIARRYNLVTNFGKFMDPLADKLLVCSALICFVDLKLIPSWIIIIIISREFIISGFRLIAADNGVVIAAGYWGKLKTVCQMIMSILLIIHIEHPIYQIIEQMFIFLSLILTVVSLVDYLYKNRQILNTNNQK